MVITYTKLRDDSWGIRAEGVTLTSGQVVSVTKRSGESKKETVGKVLWTGDGITLATITVTTVSTPTAAPARKMTASRKPRRDCGDFCQGCRLCF